MTITVAQAVEQMTGTAAELKELFPADATAPDGTNWHERIEKMLADHSGYINRLTVEQTLRRFNGDADRLRKRAAKFAA
jgi:hypothetical protein